MLGRGSSAAAGVRAGPRLLPGLGARPWPCLGDQCRTIAKVVAPLDRLAERPERVDGLVDLGAPRDRAAAAGEARANSLNSGAVNTPVHVEQVGAEQRA